MNMQKKIWYIVVVVVVVGFVAYIVANTSKKQPTGIQTAAQQQTSNANNAPAVTTPVQNGVATPTEDPQDIVAGLYKNQIQNTATQEGFTIIDSKVENNTDKNGKATDDHLEFTLKNTAGKDLTDFEVYYLITDTVAGQKEGYYKKLTGFVLKNGETQAIHFDNGTDVGHFKVNKDSLYYKSPNKLTFDVTASSAGYKTQTIQISKDAGGAEQND